jgi:hypothetical protein
MFKTDAGEVVHFHIDPQRYANLSPTMRRDLLWRLDRYMNEQVPLLHPSNLPRYHAWTTEVLACAVSKVKRRLYAKAKK